MSDKKDNEVLTTYLTKEVELHTNLLLAQRTKNNLIFSIAPFISLGVIAANEKLLTSLKLMSDNKFCLLVGLIVIIFVFLGVIGAKIEEKLWNQCNEWRRKIAELHSINGEKAFEFSSRGLIIVYVSIFSSVGLLFSALLYFIKLSVG